MRNIQVKIVTNRGDIIVELNEQAAPKTVENFLQYVNDGFYDGTIFHRVIKGFMVQGGGLDRDMNQKQTRDAITNEAANGLSNTRDTIAMARTNEPHSATAQFFINVADNLFLDHQKPTPDGWGYCVFGHVTEGLETVNAITDVATGKHGYMQDVPQETVEIESMVVI